jgi:hypothetical protein
MIGVDYDLFWTLNPKSMKPFVKAFELKQQHENQIAWLQGMYIRLAIISAFNKESKYPNKPLTDEKKKAKPKLSPAEEIKQKMFRQMQIINSRFEKGEENG